MERYLVSVLVLCMVFSCCVSQPYVPIRINTYTTGRIMAIAADHIGVELIRQISAFRQVDRPWFIVNFKGRNSSGYIWTCNAVVHEPPYVQGYVTRWNCRF